jgi:hypothetical protein
MRGRVLSEEAVEGPYPAEKPAKFARLPCPDAAGQIDGSRAIVGLDFSIGRSTRDRELGRRFYVMEKALKHKFGVGETVYFTASNVARPAASGTYEVIRLLPTDGDDCQYRIKSSTEAFERVAKESQLDVG